MIEIVGYYIKKITNKLNVLDFLFVLIIVIYIFVGLHYQKWVFMPTGDGLRYFIMAQNIISDEKIFVYENPEVDWPSNAYLGHSTHPIFILLLSLWFYAFGINMESVKAFSLFIGVIILVTTYLISSKIYSKKIGIIATWLIALNPTFIIFTINIYGTEAMASLFILIILYLLSNQCNITHKILAGFFTGLLYLTRWQEGFLVGLLCSIFILLHYDNIRKKTRYLFFYTFPFLFILISWNIFSKITAPNKTSLISEIINEISNNIIKIEFIKMYINVVGILIFIWLLFFYVSIFYDFIHHEEDIFKKNILFFILPLYLIVEWLAYSNIYAGVVPVQERFFVPIIPLTCIIIAYSSISMPKKINNNFLKVFLIYIILLNPIFYTHFFDKNDIYTPITYDDIKQKHISWNLVEKWDWDNGIKWIILNTEKNSSILTWAPRDFAWLTKRDSIKIPENSTTIKDLIIISDRYSKKYKNVYLVIDRGIFTKPKYLNLRKNLIELEKFYKLVYNTSNIKIYVYKNGKRSDIHVKW